MASWKKVIVSGSDAELRSLTINQGTGLGKCTQIISSSATDTELFGTFDGTHIGDGKQLTDVTGSKVTVTSCDSGATVARIVFTAGNGTQALCSDAGLTYNATSNTLSGKIASASVATTACTATCVNLTSAPDSSNNSYIPFSDGATGGQDLCTDTTFYYTPNTDTLTVTKLAGTATNANTASAVTVTESDTATNYTLVFATTGTGTKDLLSDDELTYNASTNLLTTAGAINATGAICSAGLVSAGPGNNAGTFSSNGSQNVVLTTGAGTSGTITINQGADSDIAITPDGTGEVVIGGSSPTISPAGGDATLTLDTGTSNVCVTNDLNVGGDLIVGGELAYLNVTNLAVEDRFILLNSGSSTGDGGIIVQNSTSPTGSAFIFDDTADRWGFTASLASSAITSTPDAYVVAAVTSDIAYYCKAGNIRTDGEDIYIYS